MNRVSALGVVVALSVCVSHARAEGPVQVRVVKPNAAASIPLYAATLAPVRRATISTRLAATVQKVLVSEGAHVKRGQLLLTLSDQDVRAQLAAANTALDNAAAHERRMTRLAADSAATRVELEAAQAQRAQASAAVAAARANLSFTQLRAPFDGTIQARRVSAGDFVGPGQPLMEIEGAELEVQATLAEEEAAPLRIGQRLRFELDGRHGEAQVTALTPGGDAFSHRRGVRAAVLDGDGLRSGAFVRIQVPGGVRLQEARVPRTALVRRGDLTGVFVAESGRAHLRWLAVGEASERDVVVRAGLSAGETIIDAPGPLRDEQAVEIVDAR